MEKKNVSIPEFHEDVDTATGYDIKQYPPPLFEIFKPATPLFVISAIALGACSFIDRSDYPKVFSLAVVLMFVAVPAAMVATYVCATNILCPICKRKCKSSFLPSGHQSSHCKTEWDTGLGSD
jgi:ABC-type dipeptide/oligopeptide/nickel transport system permease component